MAFIIKYNLSKSGFNLFIINYIRALKTTKISGGEEKEDDK